MQVRKRWQWRWLWIFLGIFIAIAICIKFIKGIFSVENTYGCTPIKFHSSEFCFSIDDPSFRLWKTWHKDGQTVAADFRFWPDGPGEKEYWIMLNAEFTDIERQELRHQLPWSNWELKGQGTIPEHYTENTLSEDRKFWPHELPLEIRNRYWRPFEEVLAASSGPELTVKNISSLVILDYNRPLVYVTPSFVGIRLGRAVHRADVADKVQMNIHIYSQRPLDRYYFTFSCHHQAGEIEQAVTGCFVLSDRFRDIVERAIAKARTIRP